MRRNMGAIVALPREVEAERVVYDDEARVRCFVLFATFGARNCAAVARLYEQEVKTLGLPAPDVRTIQRWANDEDWNGQADNLWRETKGRSNYELQILFQANTMQGQKALHNILTGMDERSIEERVVTLKAIEVAMRSRKELPELARIEPPEVKGEDQKDKPRDQREAEALAAITRRGA